MTEFWLLLKLVDQYVRLVLFTWLMLRVFLASAQHRELTSTWIRDTFFLVCMVIRL
jgi:hypothetical protein